MLHFHDFKLHARVGLVNEFLGLDAHALAVVADGSALLQAVEHHLEAVVEVGPLAVVVDAYLQGEEAAYVRATVAVALQVERAFVVGQGFLLGQRAVAVNGHDAVAVAFAGALAPDGLQSVSFHVQVVVQVV